MNEVSEKYQKNLSKYFLKYKDFFGMPPLMPIENLAIASGSIKEKPLQSRLNHLAQLYYYMDFTIEECFERVGLEITDDYMVKVVQEFKKIYGEDCWFREIKKRMYEQ